MPSTVIRSFSYDREARALYVRFQSGQLYRYDGVPPDVPESWLKVLSKGSFFSARVRDRYPHQRLRRGDDEPPTAEPVWPRPSGPASPPPAAAARSAG